MNIKSPAIDIKIHDNNVYLNGILDFDTVAKIIPQLDKFLSKSSEVTIYLEGVSYSNSVGISLLLHLRRVAKQHQVNISFNAIPHNLKELISLCGLDEVIY